MPLVLAPLVGFTLGALLALAPRGPLGARDTARARAVAALFAGLCFLPAVLHGALSHPAWSVAYVVDAAKLSPAVLCAAAVVSAAMVLLGQHACQAMPIGSPSKRIAVAAAPAASAAVVLVTLADRLSIVGSYTSVVRASTTSVEPLAASKLGAALGLLCLLLGAGAWISFRTLSELGDAHPARE